MLSAASYCLPYSEAISSKKVTTLPFRWDKIHHLNIMLVYKRARKPGYSTPTVVFSQSRSQGCRAPWHQEKFPANTRYYPTFPIWLNIPLSKSSAFFKPLSICETLAVGMAIITP